MTYSNPWARPIDYDAEIAYDLQLIEWCETGLRLGYVATHAGYSLHVSEWLLADFSRCVAVYGQADAGRAWEILRRLASDDIVGVDPIGTHGSDTMDEHEAIKRALAVLGSEMAWANVDQIARQMRKAKDDLARHRRNKAKWGA